MTVLKLTRNNSDFEEYLQEFRQNKQFMDLVFICKNQVTVTCHKVIVASVSSFLKFLILENNAGKSDIVYISLPDINSDLLLKMVKILYQKSCTVEAKHYDEFKELISQLRLNFGNLYETSAPFEDVKPECNKVKLQNPIRESNTIGSACGSIQKDLEPLPQDCTTLFQAEASTSNRSEIFHEIIPDSIQCLQTSDVDTWIDEHAGEKEEETQKNQEMGQKDYGILEESGEVVQQNGEMGKDNCELNQEYGEGGQQNASADANDLDILITDDDVMAPIEIIEISIDEEKPRIEDLIQTNERESIKTEYDENSIIDPLAEIALVGHTNDNFGTNIKKKNTPPQSGTSDLSSIETGKKISQKLKTGGAVIKKDNTSKIINKELANKNVAGLASTSAAKNFQPSRKSPKVLSSKHGVKIFHQKVKLMDKKQPNNYSSAMVSIQNCDEIASTNVEASSSCKKSSAGSIKLKQNTPSRCITKRSPPLLRSLKNSPAKILRNRTIKDHILYNSELFSKKKKVDNKERKNNPKANAVVTSDIQPVNEERPLRFRKSHSFSAKHVSIHSAKRKSISQTLAKKAPARACHSKALPDPGYIVCSVCHSRHFYKFRKQARKYKVDTCASCRKFITDMERHVIENTMPSVDLSKGCITGKENCSVSSEHLKCYPACLLKRCLSVFSVPEETFYKLNNLLPVRMRNLPKPKSSNEEHVTETAVSNMITPDPPPVGVHKDQQRRQYKKGEEEENFNLKVREMHPSSSRKLLRKAVENSYIMKDSNEKLSSTEKPSTSPSKLLSIGSPKENNVLLVETKQNEDENRESVLEKVDNNQTENDKIFENSRSTSVTSENATADKMLILSPRLMCDICRLTGKLRTLDAKFEIDDTVMCDVCHSFISKMTELAVTRTPTSTTNVLECLSATGSCKMPSDCKACLLKICLTKLRTPVDLCRNLVGLLPVYMREQFKPKITSEICKSADSSMKKKKGHSLHIKSQTPRRDEGQTRNEIVLRRKHVRGTPTTIQEMQTISGVNTPMKPEIWTCILKSFEKRSDVLATSREKEVSNVETSPVAGYHKNVKKKLLFAEMSNDREDEGSRQVKCESDESSTKNENNSGSPLLPKQRPEDMNGV